MKTYLKIGIGLLVAYIFVQYKCCQSQKLDTPNTAAEVLNIVHDTTKITKYLDRIEYKKDAAKVESLESLIEILRGDSSKHKYQSDSLANELQKTQNRLKESEEKLKSLTIFNSQMSAEIAGLLGQKKDSTYYASFNSPIPNWYWGKVQFDQRTEKFDLTFSAKDSYKIIQTDKGFKIENQNPYISIEGMNSFEVTKPKDKSKLGLGFTLGYGAVWNKKNGFQHGTSLTTGLTYRIF
jgi:hypothetical protein